ncbi:hypothetical protein FOZ62_005255 [Perkinsus olseni]|nr:hypothetical protein FOZ62_005255 [Perkinsus olseni]
MDKDYYGYNRRAGGSINDYYQGARRQSDSAYHQSRTRRLPPPTSMDGNAPGYGSPSRAYPPYGSTREHSSVVMVDQREEMTTTTMTILVTIMEPMVLEEEKQQLASEAAAVGDISDRLDRASTSSLILISYALDERTSSLYY